MAVLGLNESKTTEHPLDVVEQIIVGHEWPFDRHGNDELAVGIAGSWCEFQLWFSWNDERHALQICCAYDMKVPAQRRPAVHGLLALLNEQLWLGHFDMCSSTGVPMFRHTVMLRDGAPAEASVIEEVLAIAIGEAERFYPAFQFVVWANKQPGEAMAAALIETAGRA
jgi:hypothetical protein